jgi:tetratricopeptide (TPR) repeat protein
MTTRPNQREAKARFILGVVLSNVCGEEYAAELYRQALRHDPEMGAAQVRLGISYAHAEDYAAMLAAFSEAINLDSEVARTAACAEPAEALQIYAILFPAEPAQLAGTYASRIPAEFEEAGELVALSIKHLAAERDEEAVRALERSLSIDETHPLAIALLSLAYLFLRKHTGTTVSGEESVLWGIAPSLAATLFGS